MRIALGSDHAGFYLKERLKASLRESGFQVEDEGAFSTDAVDYPDIAVKVAEVIRSGRADRGVLICGSGVGVSVAANRIPGIRAAVCHDVYSAHQGVEHDDMNVLVLGARVIGDEVAGELCRAFMAAKFTGEERHVRRLAKVQAIEDRYRKTS